MPATRNFGPKCLQPHVPTWKGSSSLFSSSFFLISIIATWESSSAGKRDLPHCLLQSSGWQWQKLAANLGILSLVIILECLKRLIGAVSPNLYLVGKIRQWSGLAYSSHRELINSPSPFPFGNPQKGNYHGHPRYRQSKPPPNPSTCAAHNHASCTARASDMARGRLHIQ